MSQFLVVGRLVGLRYFLEEDINDDYVTWMNDPEVISYLEHVDLPVTRQNLEDYFHSLSQRESQHLLAIIDLDTMRHVGNLKIGPVDTVNSKCFLGIMIGDNKSRGRGVGTEATRLGLEFAFRHLRLNRVELSVSVDNTSAVRAYDSAGFVVEGRRRQARWIDGHPVDAILMSALRDEWLRDFSES
jgi:[ribosomal protein S5]-alanine N-acetyltransferase